MIKLTDGNGTYHSSLVTASYEKGPPVPTYLSAPVPSTTNAEPLDENDPPYKSLLEKWIQGNLCLEKFRYNQNMESRCDPILARVELFKLGTACVLSGGIALLSICDWWQDSPFSPTIVGADHHLQHSTYLLSLLAVLVPVYWTILYSLLLNSSMKHRRVYYLLWAYGVTFVIGSNLGYDHGMLAVAGLPVTTNIALSCCFLEERFMEAGRLL